MSYKNKMYTVIAVIIFCLSASLCTEAGKRTNPARTNAAKNLTQEDLDKRKKNYLLGGLQPGPTQTVQSGFNLSNPEESHLYDGWGSIKGFPMIHPENVTDIEQLPWIHLLAELNPEYSVLPESVSKLQGTLTHIKVVIMSTPWETPTFYHPQYMVHAYDTQKHPQQSYNPEDDPKNNRETSLFVNIKGNSGASIHFKKQESRGSRLATFATNYSKAGQQVVTTSERPIMITKPDNKVENVSEITNGSFWIIHREKNKKIATLFWILNDKGLVQHLKVLLLKPGQTWLSLMKAFEDSKWGDSAKLLRQLSDSDRFSTQVDQEEPDGKDNRIEWIAMQTFNVCFPQKNAPEEVHETPFNSTEKPAEMPSLPEEHLPHFFQYFMKQNGLIRNPTKSDEYSIFYAMTHAVNYHQLFYIQAIKNQSRLATIPPLIYSGQQIANKLLDALKILAQCIMSPDAQPLEEEIKNLLTTDNPEKTLEDMMAACQSFLNALGEKTLLHEDINSGMFTLLGLLYNLRISYYEPTSPFYVPTHRYDTPESKYPLISTLLQQYIEVSNIEEELPYIIACYPVDKNKNYCDSWLTTRQVKEAQSVLKYLFGPEVFQNLSDQEGLHGHAETPDKSGVVNINTIQQWVKPAHD